MSIAVPDVITRYFEADARRDIDGIVALFTDDAVVVDEGKTWRGPEQIRAWRKGPAARYQYTTELSGSEGAGPDRYVVTGRIDGNFPGGSANLKWRFTAVGDRITYLLVAP